jgi:hypothetical protein
MTGIFFCRCKLSTERGDILSAFANGTRFSSAGSLAADPVADTVTPCDLVLDMRFGTRYKRASLRQLSDSSQPLAAKCNFAETFKPQGDILP